MISVVVILSLVIGSTVGFLVGSVVRAERDPIVARPSRNQRRRRAPLITVVDLQTSERQEFLRRVMLPRATAKEKRPS